MLIIEGLSKLIKEDDSRGRLQGIKIIDGCILTHLLFVDGVLIFLNGGIGDLTSLKNTFSLFQTYTKMMVNYNRSTLIAPSFLPHETHYAILWFNFTLLRMVEGISYLGYKLKPLGYKIADWVWLIEKLEKSLNMWYLKYLSRDSIITLIKVVLEATHVY